MPIKAGTLAASAPGKQTSQIFDGKRMRVVWTEGDGNGEPSEHLVERTLTTQKGHPTWKIFCGDVSFPLERGPSEPPRHVYLEDLACYAIWSSNLYSKEELRQFWPFEFDNTGKIKTGRPNRGRPAYSDESSFEYAKGVVRTKNKMYEFCGGPTEAPLPTKKQKKKGDTDIKSEDETPTPPRKPSQTVLPLSFPLSPITKSSRNPYAEPVPELGNGRVKWEPAEEKRYVSGPLDGSLLPLGMAQKAIQGSPYFDDPAANHRTHPRPRAGDMAAASGIDTSKRKRAEFEVPEKIKELARVEMARQKRRKYVKVEREVQAKKERAGSEEWSGDLERRFK